MAYSLPGDVEIQSFSIDGLPLQSKVASFSVFENIKKPYHSITIDLIDDGDVLNKTLPLDGTNVLDLSFSQPGQDPYENKFTLTNVSKQVTIQNQRVARYDITGYSTHMTSFPKVQKSYQNKTGSDIVKDLVQNFLKPSKPMQVRDQSSGIFGNELMPFTVSGIQIHKAIRNAMLRSKSSKNDSSAYTLFEDNKHMVLDSLENAQDKATSNPVATYYQRPLGTDYINDPAIAQFNIINLREDATIDNSATDQAVNIQTQPFDIFGQNFSNTNIGKSAASTFFNIPYNIMRPPTFMQQVLPARKRFAAKLDSQAVTILVMLNPALTVGAGFAIDTLVPPGTTDDAVPDQNNGTYMITEIRHDVRLVDNRRPQATTTARGVMGKLPDD